MSKLINYLLSLLTYYEKINIWRRWHTKEAFPSRVNDGEIVAGTPTDDQVEGTPLQDLPKRIHRQEEEERNTIDQDEGRSGSKSHPHTRPDLHWRVLNHWYGRLRDTQCNPNRTHTRTKFLGIVRYICLNIKVWAGQKEPGVITAGLEASGFTLPTATLPGV